MAQELIVLCDEHGNPTGKAGKAVSHNAKTPLHLAFSCYVFNDKGQFLVTQRALGKKVWPGVWTNSVCGHPAPDEDMQTAIRRRLRDELGMEATDLQVVLPDYRYKTPPFKGIIENEFCPVFVARAASEPKPNPEEVEGFKWMSWSTFKREVGKDSSNKWSWWCKDQLKRLKDHRFIKSYSTKQDDKNT